MERGRIIVNNTDYTGSFVTPNPSEPPTKDLNTVEIEGEVYNIAGSGGGGGSAYFGVFVDTQNIILPETKYVDGESYTATQDCYGLIYYQLSSGKTQITLDGVDLVNVNQAPTAGSYIAVSLLKGQTLNFISTFSGSFYLTVYGVKSGSEASYFQPIIYSTEEREVGVWINGKPLYQKTLVFEDYTNGTYQDISSLNIEEVVNSFGEHRMPDYSYGLTFPYYENNSWYSLMTFDKNNGRYYVYCSDSMASAYKLLFITIQYTKTTDIAGSGQYAALGVPAHHYDGNEKIVGTWFGETLYERTLNIGSISSANDSYVIGDKATLKIKDCVELYGKCTYETNGEKQTITLPNYNTSTYYIRIYYESDLGIMLDIPSLNGKAGIWFEYSNEAFQYYNNDIYITIRYTKTAD